MNPRCLCCVLTAIAVLELTSTARPQSGTVLLEEYTTGADFASSVSGVGFVGGEAVFDSPADSIAYDPARFPPEGTIEVVATF